VVFVAADCLFLIGIGLGVEVGDEAGGAGHILRRGQGTIV
jgi:hypothetical protein